MRFSWWQFISCISVWMVKMVSCDQIDCSIITNDILLSIVRYYKIPTNDSVVTFYIQQIFKSLCYGDWNYPRSVRISVLVKYNNTWNISKDLTHQCSLNSFLVTEIIQKKSQKILEKKNLQKNLQRLLFMSILHDFLV